MAVARAGNKVVMFLLTHPDVLQQVEGQRDASSTSFDLSKSQLPSEWSDDDEPDHTIPTDLYSTPHGVHPRGPGSEGVRSPPRQRTSPARAAAHTSSQHSPYASIQELTLPATTAASFATIIASPSRTPNKQASTLSFGKTALAQFLASSEGQRLDEHTLRELCLRKVG